RWRKKQAEHFALTKVPYSVFTFSPNDPKHGPFLIGNWTPHVNDFIAQTYGTKLKKSWRWSECKISQTILYLTAEIKTFSRLSAVVFMFFRSRIDASHARIIGHAVYRQHVRCGACIDRMCIRITAKIVEAGYHLVLESFIDYVLAPEIAHAVLNPLKVRHRNS